MTATDSRWRAIAEAREFSGSRWVEPPPPAVLANRSSLSFRSLSCCDALLVVSRKFLKWSNRKAKERNVF